MKKAKNSSNTVLIEHIVLIHFYPFFFFIFSKESWSPSQTKVGIDCNQNDKQSQRLAPEFGMPYTWHFYGNPAKATTHAQLFSVYFESSNSNLFFLGKLFTYFCCDETKGLRTSFSNILL